MSTNPTAHVLDLHRNDF